MKFAGCKTMDFTGEPQDAINRLKQAIPLYHELSHPALINIVSHFPVETGYAVVFEWFDGECLHSMPFAFPSNDAVSDGGPIIRI